MTDFQYIPYKRFTLGVLRIKGRHYTTNFHAKNRSSFIDDLLPPRQRLLEAILDASVTITLDCLERGLP